LFARVNVALKFVLGASVRLTVVVVTPAPLIWYAAVRLALPLSPST
jgi:hypothetical protein